MFMLGLLTANEAYENARKQAVKKAVRKWAEDPLGLDLETEDEKKGTSQ